MSSITARLRTSAALSAVLLLATTGCGPRGQSLDELIERAAKLPGVRASQHSKLRQEFRLVEQSQSLPHQLNTDATLVQQNAAVALASAVDDMDRVAEINDQAAAFLGALPAGDDAFAAAESGALSAKWLADIEAVKAASKLSECDFRLEFERGYFNNLDFIYQAAAASRLLLVDALHLLDEHPDAAMDRFAAAWKWTDRLAATGHLEARVQAAMVRGDALNAVEAMLNRPAVTIADWRAIQQVLAGSLNEWPSMSSTLVRERAMGLVVYEAIRLGLTDVLLTLDERSQLREEGVLDALQTASDEQIDADQAAYLTYMREIIDVADRPYFARAKHLVECDRLLRAGEHVERYPWFANRLLVVGNTMTLAQAEVARDRTRIEGWLHLLAAATGEPPPVNQLNPLNGNPYVAQNQGGQWYVALNDRRSVNPRLTMPVP